MKTNSTLTPLSQVRRYIQKCYLCPRTFVTHLSGLYTPSRGMEYDESRLEAAPTNAMHDAGFTIQDKIAAVPSEPRNDRKSMVNPHPSPPPLKRGRELWRHFGRFSTIRACSRCLYRPRKDPLNLYPQADFDNAVGWDVEMGGSREHILG